MNDYVWCWSKICGSLDEIPSVTMGSVKVKFLMNSNTTLTVLNLHQKTDPKVQQDFKGQGHYDKVKWRSHYDAAHLQLLTNVLTKYQLPTPYSFRDIARTRFYRSRSLRQGQIKVTPWRCTPTPPNQCPYQVSTFYTLRFLRYSPDKLFPADHLPTHPDTRGENKPWQPLRAVGWKLLHRWLWNF